MGGTLLQTLSTRPPWTSRYGSRLALFRRICRIGWGAYQRRAFWGNNCAVKWESAGRRWHSCWFFFKRKTKLRCSPTTAACIVAAMLATTQNTVPHKMRDVKIVTQHTNKEIHGSPSESWRWGVVLNRVVSWHPLSLPFNLLPSFNMSLMGMRMGFTSEPDSMDLFSIWKKLKSKRLTTGVLISELLFADAAAIATHSEIERQRLVDRSGEACDLFGLIISVKKTESIG